MERQLLFVLLNADDTDASPSPINAGFKSHRLKKIRENLLESASSAFHCNLHFYCPRSIYIYFCIQIQQLCTAF